MPASLRRLAALRAMQKQGAEARARALRAAHDRLAEALAEPLLAADQVVPAHLLEPLDDARQALAQALPKAAGELAVARGALLRANVELKQVEMLVERAEQALARRRERAEALAVENWLRHRPPGTGGAGR